MKHTPTILPMELGARVPRAILVTASDEVTSMFGGDTATSCEDMVVPQFQLYHY